MADLALNNSAPNMLQTGVKFGRIRRFYLSATFATGVASVVAAGTDDGVSIAKDATGDYDVTFPKGVRFLGAWASLDPGSDTPSDAAQAIAQPRSFDATAGTGKIIVSAKDDGDQEDPGDTVTLYLFFDIGIS